MFELTEEFVEEFFCKVMIEYLIQRFGSCAYRTLNEYRSLDKISSESSDIEDT